MVIFMKTTMDIAEAIFTKTKSLARKEKTTIRALVEEGLRRILTERDRKNSQKFQLRGASFKGKGVSREIQESSWRQVSELIYKGRGE